MVLDIRAKLEGFSTDTLNQHLKTIENNPEYGYYADVLRAFLSEDSNQVKTFQEDERFLVAVAASCNPKADLESLRKKIKKFALAAAINPSLDLQTLNRLHKNEHPIIPVLLSANLTDDPEVKAFSVLGHAQSEDVDEDSIDSWFEFSIDGYEDSPTQSISEIMQLLTLELLGFFKEGGSFPFWQMLEDIDLEPTDRLWKELGALPRVPKEIYLETPIAINIHVARELAAEKSLPRDLIDELVTDDCRLGDDINNSDSWFISRSPRASIARSTYTKPDLLNRIIQEEISTIDSQEEFIHGSMGTLWRVAGNEKLRREHVESIFSFCENSISKCSNDWMFTYDILSLLEGGAYVDAPLLNNPVFPTQLKSKFEALITNIKEVGKKP